MNWTFETDDGELKSKLALVEMEARECHDIVRSRLAAQN